MIERERNWYLKCPRSYFIARVNDGYIFSRSGTVQLNEAVCSRVKLEPLIGMEVNHQGPLGVISAYVVDALPNRIGASI